MNTNKGFTLVETLVAVGISSSAALLLLQTHSNKIEQENNFIFAQEMSSIIDAVDKRIAIDGYDSTLWNKKEWLNESEIVSDLLSKELISSGSNCPNGTWNPSLDSEKQKHIIQCDLWKVRNGLDLDMNAKINVDSFNFIQSFDFFFNFKNTDDFEDNFINLKAGLNRVFSTNKNELSGLHTVDFVEKNNPLNYITSLDCVNDPLNCSIKLSLNRTGGNEYIRADGKNSMINDHLTFIETKGQSPIKCVRWINTTREGTGSWSQIFDEECGVGIYKNGTSPVMVDTVSDTGTFKNVVLDQECVVYEWNGSNVVNSGKTSPCGMTSNGSDVYQTVENTIANTATIETLEAANIEIPTVEIDDLTAKISTINELITPLINAEVINITNELNINGISAFKDLATFNDEVVFNEHAQFNSTTEFVGLATFVSDIAVNGTINLNNDLNVKGNSDLSGDLHVKGNTIIEGQTDINNDLTIANNATTQNDLNVKKDSNFSNDLNVTNTVNSSNVNSISVNSNAVLSNTVASTTATATNSMAAPIGNFDNINAQLDYLGRKIENAKKKVKEKNKCESKPNKTTSSNTSCGGNNPGYITYYYSEDYYWNGGSCSSTKSQTRVENNCLERCNNGWIKPGAHCSDQDH